MHIPLERIDQSQLQALVSGKAEEALTIEYKPETYGGSDTARAEFLADVSSFANTRGGDLIIGIDAPKGVPKGLTPIFFRKCRWGNASGSIRWPGPAWSRAYRIYRSDRHSSTAGEAGF